MSNPIYNVLNMIVSFFENLTQFTYDILFTTVIIGQHQFVLWQIFGAIGVGAFIVVLIIKIFK